MKVPFINLFNLCMYHFKCSEGKMISYYHFLMFSQCLESHILQNKKDIDSILGKTV